MGGPRLFHRAFTLDFLLFYPRVKQTFVLNNDKGQLSLDKKAIEGFVRSKLIGVGFVGNPKVRVHATKRKINVNVKGQLTRTSAHIGKTELLMEKIRSELQKIQPPQGTVPK
ncbi:MAG: alkaline shock response membrane anchor protein AmaP [Enterococcus italicus]|uniref:alkaline shock response membrane anchor protein AmaP n=1 Tax=Enterococcus italicus TaxID=246144 RepID=UPI0039943921